MQTDYRDTRCSLIVGIREQQDQAWREFFEIYTPIILGYAVRKGLSINDAEEVAQQVLIDVANSIKNFEYQPVKGRFRDWLGIITKRKLYRFWEERKQNELLTEHFERSVSADGADGEWTSNFQGAILQAALQRIRLNFAEVTWGAFAANWIDKKPAKQVAEEMGIAIEIVYNAKSRVLKQLEAEVLRICDDCAWL